MNGREIIIRRTAKLFKAGDVINLGAGMPAMVKNYIEPERKVTIISENGIIGVTNREEDAPYDRYSTDASEMPVGIIPGGSLVDSSMMFGLVRGGHVSATVLGAMQVDQEGNLANWYVPGGKVVGMGGAMDLVAGAKKVIVVMDHITKDGSPKILNKCTYPLTGERVVSEIVTNLAYFEITDGTLVLKELAPGVSLEEVAEKTEAAFVVSENLCIMDIL